MMSSPLRIAVIGVGAMGSHHARVLADMPEVNLVAVADTDQAKIERNVHRFRVRGYTDPLKLMDQEQPEAVTICVPTIEHYPLALEAIRRGLHVLIEKPIALSSEQGREIVAAAEKAGVTLMVGHIERFNPAVIALRQRILNGELGRVFQIDARRTSPFPVHIRDVGVVIDLAVHELDVMRYITGAEVKRIYAEIEQRVHASHEDQLEGLVKFCNGAIGNITVNWITPTKVRELAVTGERGMFVVNYLTQDLTFYENTAIESSEWESLQLLRGVSEGPMTRFVVPKKEPLRAELEAFVAAIHNGHPPEISGQDGVIALWLAELIVQAGREHRMIEVNGYAHPAVTAPMRSAH